MTNDLGLHEDHKEAYNHKGRWVIAAAVILGWLLAVLTTLPDIAIGFLFAFLDITDGAGFGRQANSAGKEVSPGGFPYERLQGCTG